MRKNYSMWDEIKRMQDEMDALFEGFFSGWPLQREAVTRPLIATSKGANKEIMPVKYRHPVANVYETEKDFVAELEMPGINKSDIKVNVKDGYLEIKAEKKQEKREEKKGTKSYQSSYCGFYRNIPLPDGVDERKISGNYKDGVLKLSIPKTGETKKLGFEVKIN